MASSSVDLALCFFFLCLTVSSTVTSEPVNEPFLHCLTFHSPPSTNFSQLLYTPNNPSFSSILQSSIKNLLFVTPATHQPIFLIVPVSESHVQASVICCRDHGFQIRVRSGGHDYEGLSYRSESDHPFVIIDLVNLRSVDIDVEHSTATVQAGATIGELYYRIAEKSNSLAFSAGICPTVGVGGHISGGGFGTILRKHGLSVDNVLDAKLVDVKGRVLDRASMGEDLFWAIRGGGGASFGVIVSWKLNLVPVPYTVTVFSIHKTLGQGAIELVDRWQYVAPKVDEKLFIRIVLQIQYNGSGGKEVEALFNSLFLGGCGELLQLMAESFPELGLEWNDCKEMSWAQSVMYFADYKGKPMEVLLDRGWKPERFFKAKSDYVTEPIPPFVFQRIWGRFLEDGAGVLIMDPYGGKMSRIPESATPFPHRGGILYNIQYFVEWRDGGDIESNKRMGWIRSLYRDMGPYVSKQPRSAYFNYKDLDLGRNRVEGNITNYANAMVWGLMYFNDNFARLARVKGSVDPNDFFRNEQSIPSLVIRSEEFNEEPKPSNLL